MHIAAVIDQHLPILKQRHKIGFKRMVKGTNIPDTLIYLNVNWKISSSINWNIGIKSVAGRRRHTDDTRNVIDDYNSVSTSLTWSDVLPNLTLAISGTNITDSYLTEPGPAYLTNDIPMTGQAYKIVVRYNF